MMRNATREAREHPWLVILAAAWLLLTAILVARLAIPPAECWPPPWWF
jgi:hypothetical protein